MINIDTYKNVFSLEKSSGFVYICFEELLFHHLVVNLHSENIFAQIIKSVGKNPIYSRIIELEEPGNDDMGILSDIVV